VRPLEGPRLLLCEVVRCVARDLGAAAKEKQRTSISRKDTKPQRKTKQENNNPFTERQRARRGNGTPSSRLFFLTYSLTMRYTPSAYSNGDFHRRARLAKRQGGRRARSLFLANSQTGCLTPPILPYNSSRRGDSGLVAKMERMRSRSLRPGKQGRRPKEERNEKPVPGLMRINPIQAAVQLLRKLEEIT